MLVHPNGKSAESEQKQPTAESIGNGADIQEFRIEDMPNILISAYHNSGNYIAVTTNIF